MRQHPLAPPSRIGCVCTMQGCAACMVTAISRRSWMLQQLAQVAEHLEIS